MAISSKMLGKAVSRVFPQWLQIGGAPKKFYNNNKKTYVSRARKYKALIETDILCFSEIQS